VLEGLNEMFTINALGVEGELARCLASTNIIESPNSVVRRVSGRVTHDKDASIDLPPHQPYQHKVREVRQLGE
jgi:putative transposase